jgi:hypothetical protein
MDTRHSPASHTEKPAADAVENRMKIAVRDIGIPPRPTILAQIEQTAKDNRTSSTWPSCSAMMSPVGRHDQVANSPFFLWQEGADHPGSLLVLGLKLVVNTVAGLSLQQAFKHVPNMERFGMPRRPPPKFPPCSSSRSATASAFARKTRIPSPCSAIVASRC